MKIVIIGNGVAGVTVAETVRKEDKESLITIISDERYPFYSRPRLIEVLSGKTPAPQIVIHDAGWYVKNSIDLRLDCRVTVIDTASKTVIDQSGRSVSYDTLVIAAGASCRVPTVPGLDGDRVFTLRTIDDAEKLRAVAESGKSAIIIGGGLTGIESAFALVSRGIRVTVVEVFDRLLPLQLDRDGSAMLRTLLEAKGIAFVTGVRVRSVRRVGETVEIIAGDTTLAADFVVVAAGIKPHVSIAKDTGIAFNRAIVADACMRTSIPEVYACGDGAECNGTIYGLWQPAREQGIVCGNRILGHESSFTGSIPSARLKVAGIEFSSVGSIVADDGVVQVREKDEASGLYRKLFIKDRKLVGAILMGNVKETTALQNKIRTGEEYLV
jgi:nitrite reductase (NADH) large subunit